MKILFAVNNNIQNSYIKDIVNYLESDNTKLEVEYGAKKFFDFNQKYDIIHIHWPENLLLNWAYADSNQLEKIKKAFAFWKKQKTKIVYTLHNEKPHIKDIFKLSLYKDILANVDGIIHLGENSYNTIKKNKNQSHTIIPHSMYENLPNQINQKKSRKILGIPENRFVILCFGSIRNEVEYELIKKAFKQLNIKKKSLLIPKFPTIYFWKKSPFKRLFTNLLYFKSNFLNKYFLLKIKSIERNDIQIYLNACDIIFIPRHDALNSGNVLLGFTFKKVVIGPNIGNIGTILNETGNPTFNFKDSKSLHKSINKGLILSQKKQGEFNYEYANTNWNLKLTAKKHYDFYKTIGKQIF